MDYTTPDKPLADNPAEMDFCLYDAIVVGSGPAGSACAIFLARAGRKVLLLDKAEYPREKVCGDAISGKSIHVLRELGILPKLEAQAHGVINGLMMVSPDGKEVVVPFPKATGMGCAGYCLRRKQTDEALNEAAKAEKNITFVGPFSVQTLLRDGKNAVIGVKGDGKPAGMDDRGNAQNASSGEYRARVVVGADGSGSVVSRSLGLAGVPPEHAFMAIRGYWRGVEGLSENIELFFIDEVLPGYLWVFPMGDGTANVGLGILNSDIKKRNEHPNKILLNALAKHPILSKRFANAKLEGNIGAWTIPNGSYKKQNSGDGWVLCGDAASLVDPFSGEGVGNALASGKLAAQAIDEALEKQMEEKLNGSGAGSPDEPDTAPPQGGDGDSSQSLDADTWALDASSLKPYSERIEKELRPELEMSYKLQRASRLRFLLNLFIGKAASKPEFRQMLVDMLANDKEKERVADPLFYLKLLLP